MKELKFPRGITELDICSILTQCVRYNEDTDYNLDEYKGYDIVDLTNDIFEDIALDADCDGHLMAVEGNEDQFCRDLEEVDGDSTEDAFSCARCEAVSTCARYSDIDVIKVVYYSVVKRYMCDYWKQYHKKEEEK
jgi:hypothetical protein